MSDKLLDLFLTQCFTHEELARKVRVVKMVLECVYYKVEGSSSNLKERLPECLNVTVLNKEDASFIHDILDKDYLAEDMLYMQLRNVLEKSQNLPTITLTVAVPLEQHQQSEIGAWLRSHVDPRVMFRTVLDPSGIAGCALSWQGAFQDYTLRSAFLRKRDRVRSIIESKLATGASAKNSTN